jgi:superfamily II DNA or RNA helicase
MAIDLEAAIEDAEARLAELDRLRESAVLRLAELTQLRLTQEGIAGSREGLSALAKARLFGDLFRGREDVFAVRWENTVKGRSGYSPRCANEWKPGICGKPKVRCGACERQAFLPLDVHQLLAHLRGHQVVGIYPLLADDSCRLLAIDLDGGSWRADANVLLEECRALAIEPAVERSRSGDGAHVWFFFTDPVPAADARRLGFAILTGAMARGATVGVESYDRLFPSQDVLPVGGFGNLIALPLQRGARQLGNTEFLDTKLNPHPDQWGYLASIPRITPDGLDELIRDWDGDRSLAVRPADEGRDPPWRPPRTLRQRLAGMPVPEKVDATIADRLYINRSGLPTVLMHSLRRLATFSNPMFLEQQRMRLPVTRTPRVIGCFEDLDQYLALPRGCVPDVERLLDELNIEFVVADERVVGDGLDVEFRGELSDSQQQAARALDGHDIGVLCAPPGWGKTVLATSLLASRGCSTLILVHRGPLVEQWNQQLSRFLDIPPKSVGRIGAGRRRITRCIDIAMVQTLARRPDIREFLRPYGHIIVDECHHVPAVSIDGVLSAASARFITGLTATPYRRDGHQPIITMQCGPVRHTAQPDNCQRAAVPDRGVIRRQTNFDSSHLPTGASIQEIYGALASDPDRLELVVSDIGDLVAQRRALIVLTERREHLERLADQLSPDMPDLVVLHGGVKPKVRRAALAHLAELPDDAARLILATGRYIGEGFDDPRLDTLLLTMPVAWKGTVIQYAGRLHRAHPAKRDIRIYDYVDSDVAVLRRMYAKRMRAYADMGYATDDQLAVPLDASLAS